MAAMAHASPAGHERRAQEGERHSVMSYSEPQPRSHSHVAPEPVDRQRPWPLQLSWHMVPSVLLASLKPRLRCAASATVSILPHRQVASSAANAATSEELGMPRIGMGIL